MGALGKRRHTCGILARTGAILLSRGGRGACGEPKMERIVTLHIEKLPEGVYLATSDEVQGLVAQGRTVQETVEIARDVARKLIELQGE